MSYIDAYKPKENEFVPVNTKFKGKGSVEMS